MVILNINIEKCRFEIKARREGGIYKIVHFKSHDSCCSLDRILKYNRTYIHTLIGTIEDLLSQNMLVSNKEIRLYVNRINVDNITYYRNVAMKNLCIDNVGAYRELESYLNMLKEIYPGSNTSIIMDGQHFHSVFVCLTPWIELFLGLKKNNIALDATFLTGVNGGACFAAVFSDTDNNIYTLGISVF